MSLHKHGPLGVFGGTFDPIHLGHTKTVAQVAERLALRRVKFIPSRLPPHRETPGASAEQRLQMLELALADQHGFEADDTELHRTGPSYTIDTLLSLQQDGYENLCLIVGADAFIGLESWHRWDDIFELANIIVMQRPGVIVADETERPPWWKVREARTTDSFQAAGNGMFMQLMIEPVDLSASKIRTAIQTGGDASQYLAPDVMQYINQHKLYLTPQAKAGAQSPMQTMQTIPMQALENAQKPPSDSMQTLATQALENAKAHDITLLDVRGMTDIADYMLVASGTSDRHVKALAEHVQGAMREHKIKPIGLEGEDACDWILLDYGDLIVHVMRDSTRQFYDLEGLWGEEFKQLIQKHTEADVLEV